VDCCEEHADESAGHWRLSGSWNRMLAYTSARLVFKFSFSVFGVVSVDHSLQPTQLLNNIFMYSLNSQCT
jgi:hypothetical protein